MYFSLISVLCILLPFVQSREGGDVSCGSVIKLMNLAHKVRLHSHDVKYGSGSGQQSVTGVSTSEDVNSHWVVKGVNEKDVCSRGEPIECGQKVRLEHLTTKKNLHSHHFSSPLSSEQEVSAFGDSGVGDSGDIWKVMCEGDFWNRDEKVMFKHHDTGAFLSTSGQTFGRPISGQYEIVGRFSPDSYTDWRVQEGVYIHKSEFNPIKSAGSHDEL
jgi:dolichyl-phosphate-mannose--protein O-mannosyl transferase